MQKIKQILIFEKVRVQQNVRNEWRGSEKREKMGERRGETITASGARASSFPPENGPDCKRVWPT